MKFQAPNFQFSIPLYRVTQGTRKELWKKPPDISTTSLRTSLINQEHIHSFIHLFALSDEALPAVVKRIERRSFNVVGKWMFYTALTLCSFLFFPLLLPAQDFTQTIERTARFTDAAGENNELKIYNIQGSVSVEGYGGDEIRITARQEINGTAEEITQARDELEFVVDREGRQVLIYIDAPFIEFRKDKSRIGYRMHRWDEDNYDFIYDITVQVPRRTGIHASTINNGNVSIHNTSGNIEASNVNGSLNLQDISGRTTANTVNGDITIRYTKNPIEDSHYQTINGTIDVRYPDGLSADIRFKSLHGELYTDFRNTKRLQARVETDRRRKESSTRYKIDRFAPIRIGDGGPTFSFEVLNGDVYIKRIQS